MKYAAEIWKGRVTLEDPITHRQVCKDCWNGQHDKGGCKVAACKCGCYGRKVRTKNGLKPPRKGCKQQMSFDVPMIEVR